MKYLKEKFKNIDPYSVTEIKDGIYLNANEAFYDTPLAIRQHMSDYILKHSLNRYPDTDTKRLNEAIAKKYNVSSSNVSCGVGSDEVIDVILRASASNKKIVTMSPSFSMYSIFTFMNEGEFIAVPLEKDFSFNVEKMIDTIKKEKPIATIICNPNNPTGTLVSVDDIEKIAKLDIGMLIVDEAYEDFAKNTAIDLLKKYDNMCILRTFSKAYALAGIRVGYAISSPEIINMINAVKPPYTLNDLSIETATYAISNYHLYDKLIEEVIKNREYLYQEIKKLGVEVYPSKANFLFIKISDKIRKSMSEKNIFLRILGDYTRVTVGSEEENKLFLKVLKENI